MASLIEQEVYNTLRLSFSNWEISRTVRDVLEEKLHNFLVNKTEEDLKREYPYWQIEKYSSNEIILYKEFNSNCGQHFLVKGDEGKITVYKVNENGEEEVYEKTEISVEYLSETDKIKIMEGIKVNGIEELNQLLEDFE